MPDLAMKKVSLRNRDVFEKDPVTEVIPNLGVAKLEEPHDTQQWATLRHELDTFVCEGEYLHGLERVLKTYLAHLQKPQQPAVWVSGFYGSGKSHFVRVLESLWIDRELDDGSHARGRVNLPAGIRDLLKEQSTNAARHGGAWSAAGTLLGGGPSVRLSVLGIILRAAGLPEAYNAARAELWLRKEQKLDAVADFLKQRGYELRGEWRHMYVSTDLAEALRTAIPGWAQTNAEVHQKLRMQFPLAVDITRDEFITTVDEVLKIQTKKKGDIPLTLVVLDEVQQYLGTSGDRTPQLQDLVEACQASFGSKLVFIGTGQAALEANAELQKLQGRFTVRVVLQETDVQRVVREVVLRKRTDRVESLKGVLDDVSGEIDRHLQGTKIGPRPSDRDFLVADYPLLPARRRFWEALWRKFDISGKSGMLRAQLMVLQDAAKEVGDKPLGWVVPSDFIYAQIEEDMQKAGLLSTERRNLIRQHEADGSEVGRLRTRVCGLVFLIGQLPRDGAQPTGVHATAEILADLLVEDLKAGGNTLRQQMPKLLDDLCEAGVLMKVENDEYRLQTRASAEWEADYRARLAKLRNDDAKIQLLRAGFLREAVMTATQPLVVRQGLSKTKRTYRLYFNEAPAKQDDTIPVIVRDEWSSDTLKETKAEAQAAGTDSPTVWVYLPKHDPEQLRDVIAVAAAREETHAQHPAPQADDTEGHEARSAMQTQLGQAVQKRDELIAEVLDRAIVIKGGGMPEEGDGDKDLPASLTAALEASAVRLFTQFHEADRKDADWEQVQTKAQADAGGALVPVGHSGEVLSHPVCSQIRSFLAAGPKKGSEVREKFKGSPYGWPANAIDAGLMVLLGSGQLKASKSGTPVRVQQLTTPQLISGTEFVVEGVVLTVPQRIQVRALLTECKVKFVPDRESESVPEFLKAFDDLASSAGGASPLPAAPSSTAVQEIRTFTGNAQLEKVWAHRDTLRAEKKDWEARQKKALARQPRWTQLLRLLSHAKSLACALELGSQRLAIEAQRSLLGEPDPVTPLWQKLTSELRSEVKRASDDFAAEHTSALTALAATTEWQATSEAERQRILAANELTSPAGPDLHDDETLLKSLDATSLSEWSNRLAAVAGRVAKARQEALKLREPKAVTVHPKSATLKSAGEVRAYVADLEAELMSYVSRDVTVVI